MLFCLIHPARCKLIAALRKQIVTFIWGGYSFLCLSLVQTMKLSQREQRAGFDVQCMHVGVGMANTFLGDQNHQQQSLDLRMISNVAH